MGSLEGLPFGSPVRFVITGFSVFAGVDANPTEELIRSLPSWLEQRKLPLPGGAQVVACTTLRVSAKDVDAWLAQQSQLLQSDPDDGLVIWVHFGVDVKAQQLRLEVQAANESTFRCPDADGWQPVGCKICEDGMPVLTSDLPLLPVVETLQAGGHNVGLSADAGRYLCNYIYYHSLQRCRQDGACRSWQSVFVHVPSFETIGRTEQLHFAGALLDALALHAGKQQQHASAATGVNPAQAVLVA